MIISSSLFLFYLLNLLKGLYPDEVNIEDNCKQYNAQIYNPYFKNQQLDFIDDDCSFRDHEKTNDDPFNKICKNSSQILLMSEEFLFKNIKFKLLYILYNNVTAQKFESQNAYEEESNVYYVPDKPITESKALFMIENIDCTIVDIITNYLSINYHKMKYALFVRLTADNYKDHKLFLNIHVTLKIPNTENLVYKEVSKLVINIEESLLNSSTKTEECTDKNADQYYKLISVHNIPYIFDSPKTITQLLDYGDYTIIVSTIPNITKNKNEKKIELMFQGDKKQIITLCLNKLPLTRPIYISFFDEELSEEPGNDEDEVYCSIRKKIFYSIITITMILIMLVSCKNIKKEYFEIITINRELKEKKFQKKKRKKFNELMNEKLQQQWYNNDDGKEPIVPYAIFDKRYNEKKKVPKKRISGMEIKTYSKEIEYINT